MLSIMQCHINDTSYIFLLKNKNDTSYIFKLLNDIIIRYGMNV